MVNDTALIVSKYALKKASKQVIGIIRNHHHNLIIDKQNYIVRIEEQNVFNSERFVKKYITSQTKYCYIKGAITNSFVEALIKYRANFEGFTLIVHDATHILVDYRLLSKLSHLHITIQVVEEIKHILTTYNPVSPYGYTFDNNTFYNLLKQQIDTPLINVLEDKE